MSDTNEVEVKDYRPLTLAQQVKSLKAWSASLKKQLRKEESLRKQFAKLDEECFNIRKSLRELRENPPRRNWSL